MLKIGHPVLDALSKNELKKNSPLEMSSKAVNDRSKFTYLEAFSRTLSGIAPWLELGSDNSIEGKLRKKGEKKFDYLKGHVLNSYSRKQELQSNHCNKGFNSCKLE